MKPPLWYLAILVVLFAAGVWLLQDGLRRIYLPHKVHKPAVPPEIERGPVNVVFTNRQILWRGTNQYGEWVLSLHTNTPIRTNVEGFEAYGPGQTPQHLLHRHWIAIGMRTAMADAPFTNVVMLGRDLEPTSDNELSIRYSDGTVFRMPLKTTVDKGW